MSCRFSTPTFRLLDAYVGWEKPADPDYAKNLTGFDDRGGIHLAQQIPGTVAAGAVLAHLPPARLARGCGPCEWYLATPSPPKSRLLRRGACAANWRPVWTPPCGADPLVDGVAIAARRHRLAVADRGSGTVRVWARGGEQLVAEIRIQDPGPITFTPWGELLVTSPGSEEIVRFGPVGEPRGALPAPAPGNVERIAVDAECVIWVVTMEPDASLRLWSASRGDLEFRSATPEELGRAFPFSGVIAASPAGFCLREKGPDGLPSVLCFSWFGRPLAQDAVHAPPPPKRQRKGQLITLPIDSGMPRCRWHRVQVDADVPPATTLTVSVSTSESPNPPSQGNANQDPEWKEFPAGRPHPSDWQRVDTGAVDFLVDQPAGRYLFVRLRLTGDEQATPVVRRVRLDFPRATSLDFLPTVYRENPQAEDFTERFLSLFDASLADLDRAIERFPALLDPRGVPDRLLPWLGTFFDVLFDSSWAPEKRRRILRDLPQLYRLRGTVEGLRHAIRLIFDVEPVIQELAPGRSWGGLRRTAHLGTVRLFGKARARFRLGRSPLGGVPLRRYGNPDQDPLVVEAHRFRVLVPGGGVGSRAEHDRLEKLVATQKPAHTIAEVRRGGTGLLVGTWSAVGVDTVFAPLPSPVLGGPQGNVRLRRMSVLWSGPHGPAVGIAVGRTSVVGVQTSME